MTLASAPTLAARGRVHAEPRPSAFTFIKASTVVVLASHVLADFAAMDDATMSMKAAMKQRRRNGSEAGSDIHVAPPNQKPVVEVTNGRLLIVRLGEERLSSVLLHEPMGNNTNRNDGSESDGAGVDGPNARGTYSKDYVLRHPGTTWIHRGQGRYLPARPVSPSWAGRKHSRYVDTDC